MTETGAVVLVIWILPIVKEVPGVMAVTSTVFVPVREAVTDPTVLIFETRPARVVEASVVND